MYLFLGIVFLLLLLFFCINLWRRKRIIKKICSMCMLEKCDLLNELIGPFGYSYVSSQDLFTSRIDAWQRGFGYCALYDKAALRFNMIFDCLPVYFDYQGKTWLIEFWKGQYGINTGCEIGVYYADRILQDEEKHIERRSSLSFCYTYYNQGSTEIENWLAYRGLRPECCGLNKIPNMRDEYGVFYDWGHHWELVDYTANDALKFYNEVKKVEKSADMKLSIRDNEKYCVGRYLYNECDDYWWEVKDGQWYEFSDPITRPNLHYRGIFKNNDSTEVRLSSIDDKNDKPICHMSYNEDGFKKHCKDYKEFMEWKAKRNPVRYADNKDKNYDAKNVSHSFRLMNMCIEIAQGKGFIVNRRGIDREFLLDVKQHKYEYEDVIKLLDAKKVEMDEAIANSTLPDNIDVDFVNDFVVKIRKKQFKSYICI